MPIFFVAALIKGKDYASNQMLWPFVKTIALGPLYSFLATATLVLPMFYGYREILEVESSLIFNWRYFPRCLFHGILFSDQDSETLNLAYKDDNFELMEGTVQNARRDGKNLNNFWPLIMQRGSVEMIKRFAAQEGVDLNPNILAPLLYAGAYRRSDAALVLIESGAELTDFELEFFHPDDQEALRRFLPDHELARMIGVIEVLARGTVALRENS